MSETLEYLFGLERLGITPGLERIEKLLVALGNPEQKFPAVHVAGTNGKGSTCCFIERVLREQGYKTGLYTSPHLVSFRERIQIKGEMIPEKDLIALVEEVRRVNEQEKIGATFFEFVTAVAFLYFERQGVEIAVVEVGMGGLLDATNVVQPEVAVVTNVGLDHTEFLGDTKEKIALEKGGVFKTGAAAVTGERDEKVLAVLEGLAEKANVKLLRADQELSITILKRDLEHQVVEVIEKEKRQRLTTRMVGNHQADNLAAALVTLSALRERGWKVGQSSVERGIKNTFWPGRLQVLQREPLVMADAAHNEDGWNVLGQFLQTIEWRQPAVLLVGLKKNRDVQPFMEHVAKYFDRIVVSQADYMPEAVGIVGEKLRAAGIVQVEEIQDRKEAWVRARELAEVKGMVLVTGSIYFVGDIMKEISKSIRQPAKRNFKNFIN